MKKKAEYTRAGLLEAMSGEFMFRMLAPKSPTTAMDMFKQSERIWKVVGDGRPLFLSPTERKKWKECAERTDLMRGILAEKVK
jgi:hypothetical protein